MLIPRLNRSRTRSGIELMGRRLLISSCLPFALAGCTAWPEQGAGGMAERDATTHSAVVPNEIPGEEQALRFDLELTSRHPMCWF